MSSGGQLLVGRSTQSVYSFSMFPAGKHVLSTQDIVVPFLSSSLLLSLAAQNTATWAGGSIANCSWDTL